MAVALVMIVASTVAGVVLGASWEALPEPAENIGIAGAIRRWFAVAAGVTTAIATAFLAWFARRVPDGVSGLLKRLDDADSARPPKRHPPLQCSSRALTTRIGPHRKFP